MAAPLLIFQVLTRSDSWFLVRLIRFTLHHHFLLVFLFCVRVICLNECMGSIRIPGIFTSQQCVRFLGTEVGNA